MPDRTGRQEAEARLRESQAQLAGIIASARDAIEFQQFDAGTGKKYGGTGLGLALTKRLVEAQGGRVGVRSTPGEGSLFFAVMPRRTAGTPAEGVGAEWR